MRIVQVCPYDIDRPGGVQRHVLDTAAALSALGHQVTIIAPRTGTGARRHDGVEVRRIGRARRIGFSGTNFEISIALGGDRRALKSLMRDGKFDIAHYHTVWTPLLALQALGYFRGPAVATFHDTPPATFSGRMLRGLFRVFSRFLLRRFGAIITPSDAPRRHLVPGPGQAIIVMPPCTDLRRFHAAEPDPRFRDGRVNILFLGRLEPRKGARLLLKAYGLLRTAEPTRLIIAGGGEQEGALRAFVAAQGLENVVFAGSPDETAPWHATADIFCAPSPHGESFGIVIAEAMASGKPVVAAANEGYRTLLTGEAGRFLTPPGDVEAIRAALAALIADPALRARLGAWGRAEAARYDCRGWAPRLVDIYRTAIGAHAS